MIRLTLNRKGDYWMLYIHFQARMSKTYFFKGLLEAVPVKHRRPRKGDESGKRSSFLEYHIRAFTQLYGISFKRVRRLQTLLLLGQSPKDMRGQQGNRKSVPAGDVQAVKVSHHASKELKYLDA
ncbi:hypothetical protein PR048_001279 [Dryococelus australis]|uniref:Uncharacterized protein n=1 Tax=Dryococelus australis TaxID=614101 RepID=A0ABQ9IGX6_9NEOP|nr:hypothetical protein PR048_001279 [Dryococelus australis]